MVGHHKESPSHYNAWVHCCRWESHERQTDEASAGTHNHEELQKGILDLNYEPDTFVARWANDWAHAESGDTCTLQSELRLEGTLDGVRGIYGTADLFWIDSDNNPHFADLKTFSDGTEDYLPQLKGYCSLWLTPEKIKSCSKAYFHILHGGICKVETVEYNPAEAYSETVKLLESVRGNGGECHLCKYCQWCKHIKECEMTNNAVQIVNGNGAVDFSKMSLPQKLVICDTIKKLIKTLEDDAKEEARKNGGVLEADGIRYEIKEKSGKGKVHDLCDVASALSSPHMFNKSGESVEANGISQEKLLSLCELPKTAFVAAMKEANADNKAIPKKNIESWCASFYDKGEPVEYLSRTK